jgi:tight adherence protein B
VTALLLAMALLLIHLPSAGAARLAALLPPTQDAPRRPDLPTKYVTPTAGAVGAFAVLLTGFDFMVALSAGLVSAAAVHIARRVVAGRAEAAERATTLEAVATLAAELRAGQQPAAALGAAAAAATGRPADILAEAAATARLGGSVPEVLRTARAAGSADRHAGGPGPRPEGPAAERSPVTTDGEPATSAGPFGWLAAAWQLSATTGAGLAEVLDDVAQTARARRQHQREIAALLAGQRATAALLAGLPVFGLGLGAAMGLHPLVVILSTPLGEAMLLLGVMLELVGLGWTDRIVRSAGAVR